jgi:prepilin-type N-terminal cleavage/methylation domain-containing protein
MPSPRRDPKISAFTLVELLVVIGIIAVLISILLPTLSKARSSANKAACLSNQRQLATALLIYAQQNKGFIPPAPNWANQSLMWEAYFDPAVFGPRRDPETIDNWFGLGFLFATKLMKDPRTFYCPEMTMPLFTYPTGWEAAQTWNAGLKGVKAIGYLYRSFGQAAPPKITTDDVKAVRTLKLGKMKNKALCMDVAVQNAWSKGTWPHRKPFGIIAAYSDGHADFVQMSKADFESSLKATLSVGDSDYYVFLLFQAMDTGNFDLLHSKFPP